MNSDNTLEVTIESRIDKSTCDSSRYALGTVQVTPAADGKVFLAATDSRILAVIEAEGNAEREEHIPAAVLPKRKKGSTVRLNGQWESSDGKFCPVDPEPGRFPRAEDVLPNIKNGEYTVLCINPKLLHSLIESLGSTDYDERGLTLFVPKPDEHGNVDSAIPVLGRLGIGVIMPLSATDDRNVIRNHRSEYQAVSDRYRSAREAVK